MRPHHMSTLPSTAEQARHALLLLGAPAPVRLLVDVHAALFDGDLSIPAIARLLRDRGSGLGAALHTDLTAVRGFAALAEWPVERRLVTPAVGRADALSMVVRVAEFVALRPGAEICAHRLLRELAHGVPGGVEAVDLVGAARAALTDPRLVAAVAAEEPVRAAAARSAAGLDDAQRLFGVPVVPQQRGGE